MQEYNHINTLIANGNQHTEKNHFHTEELHRLRSSYRHSKMLETFKIEFSASSIPRKVDPLFFVASLTLEECGHTGTFLD